MSDRAEQLKALPKIDELLRQPEVAVIEAPHWALRQAARDAVDARRKAILSDLSVAPSVDAAELRARVGELLRPSLRRVVNASGVVLHTNLGRAPLHPEVSARAAELASGYCNLEYEIEAGHRGSRHDHAVSLLRQLTGAEDAVVVNNNAGAVFLALSALAKGREVVVSRGELVEIGGSFRVPDVMEMSGASLVEVGTTNKTRIDDYRVACGEDTAVLLQVHQSNFAIVGFSQRVELPELVALAEEKGCHSMIDLGSGAFVEGEEFKEWGLEAEPSVQRCVASGVGLCTFSGDKLLSGPQAGIIVGRRELVSRCRSHPLMRALRPDKLTLATLCATLELYRDERRMELPALAMLSATADELEARARALLGALPDFDSLTVELRALESAVGGGAMPTVSLASWGLALGGASARALEARLRQGEPAVIGRIHDDQLLLDMRTLWNEKEREEVARALVRLDQTLGAKETLP